MRHIGIGKRGSHVLWIVLGALALIAIAYVWTHLV